MDGAASCGSCDATLTVVNDAVETLRPLAERLGITFEVIPRTVGTFAEAAEHEIVSSPTIRAAGIELRPSHPDDSERRVWTWRGDTSTAVSAEAVLDTVVRALAAHSARFDEFLAAGGPSPYTRQFLSGSPAEPALAGSADESCGCATACG